MTSHDEPSGANPNPYASPLSPYESATGDADGEGEGLNSVPSLHRAKRRVLMWMMGLGALFGFFNGLFNLESDTDNVRVFSLITGLCFCALVLRWCAYDRIEYQMPRWAFFTVYVVICPTVLIIIPIYLFASRGAGGFLATLKAAGVFIAWGLVGGVAGALGMLTRSLVM